MFNASHEVTSSTFRSAELEREKRLRLLSDADRDIIRLAHDPLLRLNS
ncbi:hypothetical protein [Streptomyces antibioticus]